VARSVTRAAVFDKEFCEDVRHWVKTDRNTAVRLLDLIEAVMRDPFQGVGKPESLGYVLEGCWSRLITQEHRLVYRVTATGATSLKRVITTNRQAAER
jgi:toxin YoeB